MCKFKDLLVDNNSYSYKREDIRPKNVMAKQKVVPNSLINGWQSVQICLKVFQIVPNCPKNEEICPEMSRISKNLLKIAYVIYG